MHQSIGGVLSHMHILFMSGFIHLIAGGGSKNRVYRKDVLQGPDEGLVIWEGVQYKVGPGSSYKWCFHPYKWPFFMSNWGYFTPLSLQVELFSVFSTILYSTGTSKYLAWGPSL